MIFHSHTVKNGIKGPLLNFSGSLQVVHFLYTRYFAGMLKSGCFQMIVMTVKLSVMKGEVPRLGYEQGHEEPWKDTEAVTFCCSSLLCLAVA